MDRRGLEIVKDRIEVLLFALEAERDRAEEKKEPAKFRRAFCGGLMDTISDAVEIIGEPADVGTETAVNGLILCEEFVGGKLDEDANPIIFPVVVLAAIVAFLEEAAVILEKRMESEEGPDQAAA